MRITGRTLRPSTLSERRFFCSLGLDHVRVPRSHNPYAVARQVARIAAGRIPEVMQLREMLATFSAAQPSCAALPSSSSTSRGQKMPGTSRETSFGALLEASLETSPEPDTAGPMGLDPVGHFRPRPEVLPRSHDGLGALYFINVGRGHGGEAA